MAPILGGDQGWCKSMVMLRGFSVSDWCIVWVGSLMTPVGQTHGLFGGHVDIGWGCIWKIKELPNFRENFAVFFGFFGQPQPGWSIQFSGRHDLQLFSSLFFGHWSPLPDKMWILCFGIGRKLGCCKNKKTVPSLTVPILKKESRT